MLIVCPSCATSYDVDMASLRPDGRQVRCVRCRTVWHAELPHREKVIAAAQALAPVRRAVEAVAEATAAAIAPQPVAQPFDVPMPAEAAAATEEPSLTGPADEPATDIAGGISGATAESDTFVEVKSPPIAPADFAVEQPPIDIEAHSLAASSAEPPEDIESVAARRYPRRAKRNGWKWPLAQLQSAILALIVADAIVIGWRADFVRLMPQTASFYALIGLPVNLRGVVLDNLTTATEQQQSVPTLVVGGDIVNTTGQTETVPPLRFAVRNAARQEIYSWTSVPPRAALQSGEAVAFHTRLASPPPDSHDVLVRFVNRYDILAGTR